MKIHMLPTGDEVHRYQKSIVIPFKNSRKVLSTSPLNGGYRENLLSAFNHDSNPGAGISCSLRTDSYLNDLKLLATEIGLDPATATGISTAASMDNVAIKAVSYENLTVTAIVTGGVEVNGGRVGDPASYHEARGKTVMTKEGTINIILDIDADLLPGTLARALVTCTEAKTAALQELMAGSSYSRGLATGSGTDGTIIIANSQSDLKLTYAGKHSKLGELIGLAVKPAVKEALFLQTGLSPKSQHSMLRRLKRFGITEDGIWNKHGVLGEKTLAKPVFIQQLESVDREEELVALTSLYVHLLDQMDWELITPGRAAQEGRYLVERIKQKYQLDVEYTFSWQSAEETITGMLANFTDVIARISAGGPDV
ncbi:adenosylcobinamide amidohydrolase [Dehalobacter sp. DCM]|uniref:adenosylcobinamide amidohydrolase n=1 Tax=Dehalobacter sp. DCM TaxID=2907827 RepID=UPI003081EF95|nr:adenosylcobinamide amidohydrolase [Dehalobacter sp. DCM]